MINVEYTKTAVSYLHVFLDNTWNLKNCAFIRLDKPEYVPEKNSKRLSTKQKEELIYILMDLMGQKRYTACVITHSKFLSFFLMIMRIFSFKLCDYMQKA